MATTKIAPTINRLPEIVQSLEYIRRVTQKPRLECQQLMMLLSLYQHPNGINMQDLAKEMSVDPSFISRNARGFGPDSKGKQLVMQRIDDDNPRYRLVQLTHTGRKVIETFGDIGSGMVSMPRVAPVADARSKA